jgi:hypothetical protein
VGGCVGARTMEDPALLAQVEAALVQSSTSTVPDKQREGAAR